MLQDCLATFGDPLGGLSRFAWRSPVGEANNSKSLFASQNLFLFAHSHSGKLGSCVQIKKGITIGYPAFAVFAEKGGFEPPIPF